MGKVYEPGKGRHHSSERLRTRGKSEWFKKTMASSKQKPRGPHFYRSGVSDLLGGVKARWTPMGDGGSQSKGGGVSDGEEFVPYSLNKGLC